LPAWSSPPVSVDAVRHDDRFRVEGLARYDGSPIHGQGLPTDLAGARFERNVREPLYARGHAHLPQGAHVWVFMQGTDGEVYMQSPPVIVQGDTWVAPNLRVGLQVAQIQFVQVDDAAQSQLSAKAGRQDWGALPQLPPGSVTLASIVLK
jgi:hypothetical protein